MANKKTDMSKLRQMLRLHENGESKLKISRLTGVSRNTLMKYLKIYARLQLNAGLLESKSDQELDHLFGENFLPEPNERYKILEPYFPKMEKELKKRGMTRQILWERYISDHPDGYKPSQFKYHYQMWLRRSKPVMHIEHVAGDKMYIDYAREKQKIRERLDHARLTQELVLLNTMKKDPLINDLKVQDCSCTRLQEISCRKPAIQEAG